MTSTTSSSTSVNPACPFARRRAGPSASLRRKARACMPESSPPYTYFLRTRSEREIVDAEHGSHDGDDDGGHHHADAYDYHGLQNRDQPVGGCVEFLFEHIGQVERRLGKPAGLLARPHDGDDDGRE